MKRGMYFAGAGAAGLLAAAVAVLAPHDDQPEAASEAPAPPRIVMAEGDDRLPSTTATDWVTYADHVVVVTAASERRLPVSATEAARGEGLIGRTVDMQVKKVLWSRKGAPEAAPKSWTYNAAGFALTNGDPEAAAPMAVHGRPRMEVGHQYIVAVSWEPARCSPGDKPEPGRWMGLGEGSEVPYDGNTIGQGEMEGRVQTAAQARILVAGEHGLEEEMIGQDAAALAAKLKATPATEKQTFSAQSQPTACD
ncbi:hypothetical protein E1293_17090 [Actinomadura darangshiensis]|uniref:Uncharacterized protein n=1 Tax=Actinomadura darangshiensis TaxID=705336 RepID=A0A4R5B9K8_9ACTN|nr:hypothetical protein [Actinomadura darangshiensis]TDD82165.1 hypothetical protein E1293_17090 [Actinomadura darangshiensis]